MGGCKRCNRPLDQTTCKKPYKKEEKRVHIITIKTARCKLQQLIKRKEAKRIVCAITINYEYKFWVKRRKENMS